MQLASINCSFAKGVGNYKNGYQDWTFISNCIFQQFSVSQERNISLNHFIRTIWKKIFKQNTCGNSLVDYSSLCQKAYSESKQNWEEWILKSRTNRTNQVVGKSRIDECWHELQGDGQEDACQCRYNQVFVELHLLFLYKASVFLRNFSNTLSIRIPFSSCYTPSLALFSHSY